MADADSIARGLHPAVVRQAGFAAWTVDPAIATLFAILRDLDKAGARLEALQHDRPDLGSDAVRGDIGAVVSLYERCPAHFFGHGWRTRANGGACAGLWELLAARRDAWIEARLAAEGFRPDAASPEKDERTMALCDEAIPVELAWARFQDG